MIALTTAGIEAAYESLDFEEWGLEMYLKDLDWLPECEFIFTPSDRAEEIRATQRMIKSFKQVKRFYQIMYDIEEE